MIYEFQWHLNRPETEKQSRGKITCDLDFHILISEKLAERTKKHNYALALPQSYSLYVQIILYVPDEMSSCFI